MATSAKTPASAASSTAAAEYAGVGAAAGECERGVRAIQSSALDLAEAVCRSKRVAAAIMWLAGLPIEEIERDLLRHMPTSSGASGTVRASAERTRDLLPAVGAVLRELDLDQNYSRLLERTMVRLELGIPSAEICDLVMMSEAVLSRTAWLALVHAGITSIETVRETPEEQLATILGSDDAARALRRACEAAASRVEQASTTLPVPTE